MAYTPELSRKGRKVILLINCHIFSQMLSGRVFFNKASRFLYSNEALPQTDEAEVLRKIRNTESRLWVTVEPAPTILSGMPVSSFGLPWPPAPLPARRAYRPEGRAYASESATGCGYKTVFTAYECLTFRHRILTCQVWARGLGQGQLPCLNILKSFYYHVFSLQSSQINGSDLPDGWQAGLRWTHTQNPEPLNP